MARGAEALLELCEVQAAQTQTRGHRSTPGSLSLQAPQQMTHGPLGHGREAVKLRKDSGVQGEAQLQERDEDEVGCAGVGKGAVRVHV